MKFIGSVLIGLLLGASFAEGLLAAVADVRQAYRIACPTQKTAEEKLEEIKNMLPTSCGDNAEYDAKEWGYVLGPPDGDGCYYVRKATKFEKIEKRGA